MRRLVFLKGGNTYAGSCVHCGRSVAPHQGVINALKQLECSECGSRKAREMEEWRKKLYGDQPVYGGPRGGRYTRTRTGGKWYKR